MVAKPQEIFFTVARNVEVNERAYYLTMALFFICHGFVKSKFPIGSFHEFHCHFYPIYCSSSECIEIFSDFVKSHLMTDDSLSVYLCVKVTLVYAVFSSHYFLHLHSIPTNYTASTVKLKVYYSK